MPLFEQQSTHQGIDGNNNQQAGGDIYNNYYNTEAMHTASAIEKVLSGLYRIQAGKAATFTPPDNSPYTVPDKIDFNEIRVYRDHYDDFTEGCALVESQIKSIAAVDPGCEAGIIQHVKSVYREVCQEYPEATADKKNRSNAPPFGKRLKYARTRGTKSSRIRDILCLQRMQNF